MLAADARSAARARRAALPHVLPRGRGSGRGGGATRFEAVLLGSSEVNPLAYAFYRRGSETTPPPRSPPRPRAPTARARRGRRDARRGRRQRCEATTSASAALAQASAEEFEAARLHGDATDAANSHLRWWCGSALSAAALRDEAVPRGRKLLRECAQVFLPTNLDAWLAALRGGDSVGPNARRWRRC